MGKLSDLYYGWWLVAACLALGSIGAGISFYSISLVANALETEFTVSRAQIMLAVTGHNLVTGLLAPKLSHLMDRVSVRKVLAFSALVAGCGFIAIAATPNIYGFIGAYALLIPALIVGLTSLCPAILLSRWFVKNRGTAIGIAALGTQIGGFVFPPLIATLFNLVGWRLTLAGLGVVVAVVIPLIVFRWVVEYPADKGLHVDGLKSDAAAVKPVAEKPEILQPMVNEALKSLKFWLLSLGLALMVAMFTAVLSNLALFATDIGIPRERAALLISLYSLTGISFSIIIGRLCDVIDVRLVFSGMLLVNIASMLLYASSDTFATLAVATAVVSISGGGFMPLWGSLVGKVFDSRIYARMFGLMSLVTLSAAAMSPFMSGWLFDVTNSYRLMFLLIAGSMVLPLLYMPLIKLHSTQAAAP